jgi:multisubunit Na+/H+ antiporter MnhG subunit
VAAAIVVREGLSPYSAQAVMTAAFLLFASPVLVHATGRAARLRERGDLRAQEHEVEEP